MYQEAGRSFTQVLERLDPSEQYKGTGMEGLDAFQRQLKRFDIKVKGTGSDVVEKFFRTADSAVLFPEYIARSVRQGMEEADLLPQLTAAVTRFDGMDYRSITSEAGGEEKELRRVDEGTEIPSTTVKVQENLVKLMLNQYGLEEGVRILDAFNRPVPVALRNNPLKQDREALLQQLRELEIEGTPSAECDSGNLDGRRRLDSERFVPKGALFGAGHFLSDGDSGIGAESRI